MHSANPVPACRAKPRPRSTSCWSGLSGRVRPAPSARRREAVSLLPMAIKLSENFRAVFYAPFYATQALGFYAREGVEIDLINSPAPAAAAPGLLTRAVPLSLGGPLRLMRARARGANSPLVGC